MENNMEKLIKERIKENEKLFNKKELIFLYNNVNIIQKIYLLGVLDNNCIYKGGQKSGQN